MRKLSIIRSLFARISTVNLLAGSAISFGLFFIFRASFSTPHGRVFTLFDDAMISMKYAKTFFETGEFIWYPGAPRVEGVTNPLWTLFMSLLHALGLNSSLIALTVSVASLLLLCVSYYLFVNILKLISRSWKSSFPFVGWFSLVAVFNFPSLFWSLRGMESSALLLALATILLKVAKFFVKGVLSRLDKVGIFAVILLGVSIRFDFLLVPFGLVAGLILSSSSWGNASIEKYRLIKILTGYSFFLGSFVSLLQYFYFGSAFPNTYWLKVGNIALTDRIQRGLLVSSHLLPLLVLDLISIIVILRISLSAAEKVFSLNVTSVMVAQVFYSIWVGGDAWERSGFLNRYSIPVLFLSTLLIYIALTYISESLYRARSKFSRNALSLLSLVISSFAVLQALVPNPVTFQKRVALKIIIVVFALLLVFFISYFFVAARIFYFRIIPSFLLIFMFIQTSGVGLVNWVSGNAFSASADFKTREYSVDLAKVIDRRAVVATVWAGAPSYFLDNPMVDILGKNDRRIALMRPVKGLEFWPGHNKWNYDYSIRQLSPDVVTGLWFYTSADLQNLKNWGYAQRCFHKHNKAYFKLRSPAVHWGELQACS